MRSLLNPVSALHGQLQLIPQLAMTGAEVIPLSLDDFKSHGGSEELV